MRLPVASALRGGVNYSLQLSMFGSRRKLSLFMTTVRINVGRTFLAPSYRCLHMFIRCLSVVHFRINRLLMKCLGVLDDFRIFTHTTNI